MTADWANLEVIDDPSDSDDCSSDCSDCFTCYYCDIYLEYEDEIFEDDEANDRLYCKRCWIEIHPDVD
jgi:hypothetical protein